MLLQYPGKKWGGCTLRPRLMALAVASCFAVTPAFGLPTGGQVVSGSARFAQSGNSLVVTNTPGAIINWNSFSVGAIESVKFQQQNSLSSVLNRVTGSGRSDIQGALLSNGRIFLINPNGILFGPNSSVNVGGLIASTLDIADQDFKDGKLAFAAGATAGTLQNAGTLAAGKNIYLIAPDIENTGIIQSTKGEILLAAGRQVTLVDGAHPDIQVVISAPSDKAVNLGDIVAGKIGVFGALIQQRGKMNADRAEVDEKGRIVFRATKQLDIEAGSTTTANGKQGGEITLQTTEGDTYVKGTVEATGKVDAGGTVQVLGQRVAVMDQASIDASGEKGGGTILVGGDYQGRNPAVQNSTITYFGPDATLKANANTKGDGGKVIVWADDTTRAYGSIEAKGGTQKGNGGFVEISGKNSLDFHSQVNTSAQNGQVGTLLLDPSSITLIAGAGISDYGGGTFNAGLLSGGTAAATVYGDDITSALSGNNVILTTDTAPGSIAFTAGTYNFSPSNAATNSLSLLAYGSGPATGNISIPAGTSINLAYGGITLVAGWDGGSTVSPVVASGATSGISITGSHIAVNGSQVVKLVAGSGGITTSGTGTGASGEFLQGKIALDSTGPITIGKLDGDFVARSTGSGSSITIGDSGGMIVSSSAIGGVGPGVSSNNGAVTLEAYGGQLYVNGPVNAGTGQVTVKASASGYDVINNSSITGGDVSLSAANNITSSGSIAASGNVSMIASAGDVDLYGDITHQSGGAKTVLLQAAGSVNILSATISGSSGHQLTVTLNSSYGGAPGQVNLDMAEIITYGGNVVIGGTANPLSGSTKGLNTPYGDLASGVYLSDVTIDAGSSGSVSIRGQAALSQSGYGAGILFQDSVLGTEITAGGGITLVGAAGFASGTQPGIFFNDGASEPTKLNSKTSALSLTGTAYNPADYAIQTSYGTHVIGSEGGAITITGNNGLTQLGKVDTYGGVASAAGQIFVTSYGALSLTGEMSAFGTSSGASISLTSTYGGIAQNATAPLNGAAVKAMASNGVVDLDNAANATGVIAGYGGTGFYYKSSNPINVSTVDSQAGVGTGSGYVRLESSYGGSAFSQSAPISTTGLLLVGSTSGQSAVLTDSGNSFSQFAASFNNPTSVEVIQTGASVLTIDTLDSISGVTANGSATKLTIGNKHATGSLVVNAPINGGTTAEVELMANGVLTVNSSQNVTGKNVWLRSGDQITLSAGSSVTAAEWAMLANAGPGSFTVSTGAGSYGGGYIAYGGLANISAGTGIALGQPDSAYGGTTSLTISAPITLSNKNLALLSNGGYIDITQPILLGTGKLIFEGGTVENIGTTITAATVSGKATSAELYFGGNIAIESFTTPDSTPQTFNGILTTGSLRLTNSGFAINDGGGTLDAPTLYLAAASLGTSAAPLKTNATTLGFSATGAGAYITNHTAASPGMLSVYGSAPNSAGIIAITNYGATYITAPGVTGYGSVSISSSGLLDVPSTASVASSYGGTSLTTTGAAPLTVYGSVSGATSVALSSGGSLMIGGSPASVSSSGTTSLTTTGGGTLTVVYGGSVSGVTGVSLTSASGGAVQVDGTVSSSGTISVAAGSVSGTGTVGGVSAATVPFSSTTPSSGGGGTTPPPPVDPCAADPASCVPTDPCIADPASCVPVDPCVANPSAPGCGSSGGGVVIPTDPIGDKLTCLIDPAACSGGGTTDPNVGNTVKTALENIDSVEQTFTTTTTTGLTGSGKVELALGPDGTTGGGGTAAASGTSGASGEPTGGSATEENKDKDKTTATTESGTPTSGAGNASIPVKYCN